jgi:predicted PurR-regulated permease PerM
MLIPFIIAFALAFVLQPVVRFFQNKGLGRGLSVIVVLTLFVVVVFLIVQTTLPHLIKEIKQLIVELPKITSEIKELLNNFSKRFDFLPSDYQPNFDNINTFFSRYVIRLGNFPKIFVDRIISYLSIMILVPMILIYFLLDYEKILCGIRNFLVRNNKVRLKNYLADLNKIMGSYFRGVFIVMIIISTVFSIVFTFLGLDFAVFFGIIIGLTNIIPYLGSYIGGALPLLFALLESPQKALLVLIFSVIIQTIESDVLTPYIQSKHIKIHPLIVILGLLVFGSLFGVIGMMVAVPILSIIKITLKHYPIIKTKNV